MKMDENPQLGVVPCLQVPRQITFSESWLCDTLPTEVVSWLMVRMGIPQSSWVLLVTATNQLAAGMVMRGKIPVNLIVGNLKLLQEYKHLDNKKRAEEVKRFLVDCNSVASVSWNQCPHEVGL